MRRKSLNGKKDYLSLMVTIEKFYGTSWCSDCKRAKQFLGEHRIPYEWVDIEQDPKAAEFVMKINNGKRKVPTIAFSDGSVLVESSNAELAKKLGLVADLGHDFHDIVIVGGGPAGLTAALYTARDGYDVVIVERGSLGGQAGFTERLDNYPGFPEGIAGAELAERIVKQTEQYGVEFLKATEVETVFVDNGILVARSTDGKETSGRALLVATGSRYKRLDVPGETDLIGYKIHFCATCDFIWYKGKEVIVVGGGNSAYEESLFLARHLKKVTILVRSKPRASPILQEKVNGTENIEVKTGVVVKEFKVGPKKTLEGVVIEHRETKKQEVLHPDGVFLFIGLTPNAEMVKDLVDLDDGGFIKTDGTLMTKTPGLFAAGDVRAGSTKQAVSAMGEGAAAALSMREYLRTH